MNKPFSFLLSLFILVSFNLQSVIAQDVFTHADTLRGSITKERAWWDALHYDLKIKIDTGAKSISGSNSILYKVIKPYNKMQIDLMQPLQIDSVKQANIKLNYLRDGNAYFITLQEKQRKKKIYDVDVYYHGVPTVAKNPPWDGGFIWKKDAEGIPWVSVACQGVGASIWYPNKDHQYDEPDSASMEITVPGNLQAISNGRLVYERKNSDSNNTFRWKVVSPINNYDFVFYAGKYGHLHEAYAGWKGNLDVDLYFLNDDTAKARMHVLPDINRMLKAFEYWFGPYPFYADGFKMVESPHLGMEHQSAIAYGNKFLNGYLGHDLSGTGIGLRWDYIVVHESGHEWFGNNITTKDIADMWVHEGITDYSETLFTEYWYGKDSADAYVQGLRRLIQNSKPVIGVYNVNKEGSEDMYFKGANMIHTIRQVINDDSLFRKILIGLNSAFYHQTVTSKQIEDYISKQSHIDFSKVFDQYLRNTQIPSLEYFVSQRDGKNYLNYHWNDCITSFNMPVKIIIDEKPVFIYPETGWKKMKIISASSINDDRLVDKNFYVTVKKVSPVE